MKQSAPNPERNPFDALRADLEKVGISTRELSWLQTNTQAWRNALERIRTDCINNRPLSESPKEVTPRRMYEITKAAIQRAGKPAIHTIAQEVGVPQDQIPALFGLGENALRNPFRKAFDQAMAGKEFSEET